MTRGCLCVFAKPPRPGEAKTRLAASLGETGAAALARALFVDTWHTATSVPWADVVLATTDVTAAEWDQLPDDARWTQGDGTLGARMERVLRRALRTYPFAIVIGTDLPGLPAARLDQAHDALRTADAVVGPTDDGGFYLLGLRRCPVGLLDDVPWSAPDTRARTVERLSQHGLTTTVTDPWFDVDEADDLARLKRLVHDGAIVAPETARILARQDAQADEPREREEGRCGSR